MFHFMKRVTESKNITLQYDKPATWRVNICITLECGPMPKVMVALPNIGGTLCSTPQSLADAHY